MTNATHIISDWLQLDKFDSTIIDWKVSKKDLLDSCTEKFHDKLHSLSYVLQWGFHSYIYELASNLLCKHNLVDDYDVETYYDKEKFSFTVHLQNTETDESFLIHNLDELMSFIKKQINNV